MKVLNVQAKDVHITLEVSASELRSLVKYTEATLPLFRKVHQGEEGLADMIENNNTNFKTLLKEIENGP